MVMFLLSPEKNVTVPLSIGNGTRLCTLYYGCA
ncbi:hypothetical protein ZBT109_2268 [Zymobacter palmae]|uniref:Uncharacterized protein n=1 Tax=Zymobacter palmae TaxID=33074 RepID=A0A348HH98_9GAMM|nr:hypothetical protein ZBT109_2268 [Zymobacter palmae]